MVYLGHLNVTTTAGERFDEHDTCLMAAVIAKRFGWNMSASAAAWRRLLGNTCSDDDFAVMASLGRAALSMSRRRV